MGVLTRGRAYAYAFWLAAAGLAAQGAYAGLDVDPALEAAFVYNFAKFTDWPDSMAGMPFTLCVADRRDELFAAFHRLEGRPVHGRELHVRRLGGPADALHCQVVFVGDIVAADYLRALPAALTVGDSEGFAAAGGVIGLIVQDNRMQFEVNLEAARRANLKLSSQMLKLARIVK
jgi:hypothetical protein